MLETASHQAWTLAWWDWWFALNWWQGLLAALVITPIGLLAVRLVIQGLWVNPFTHDWMSFNFDVFLGCGVGAMLWLAHIVPAGNGHTSGWPYLLLNYGSIAFWFAFAMFKWWDERKEVTTWSRRLGATSVYHIFVLVYIGGLYVVLFANTVAASWTGGFVNTLAHLTPILAVGAWLFAGMVLDPKFRTAPNGQSKFVYTSPRDGWRNVRWLLAYALGH